MVWWGRHALLWNNPCSSKTLWEDIAVLRPHRNAGFTLVEMLILMVLIGILAAIVLTRVLGGRVRANEANARGSLDQLRKAVGEFESDCGAYPMKLTDLTLHTAPSTGVVWAGTGTGSRSIPASQYKGPYLPLQSGYLPVNKLTGGSAEGTDWTYDNSTILLGTVSMPSSLTGNDTSGTPFSEW
jgi:general secretion pathway protein G